jgi:hypothetical protein
MVHFVPAVNTVDQFSVKQDRGNMKRKIILPLLLVLLTAASCGSAGGVHEADSAAVSETEDRGEQDSGQEKSDGSSEASEAAESSEENSGAIDYSFRLSSQRVVDSAYSEDGNHHLLVKSEYDLLSAAEEDENSGDTGIVRGILDQINQDTQDQTGSFVSENKGTAQEQYESQGGEYFGNYENDNDLTVERADSRVLSVVRENYVYTGGAHGYSATTAYSYDAETGERLKLADVLTSTENIVKILSDELVKQNASEKFDFGTDELEQNVQKLMDGDEYYNGDNDTHYVTWYVGDDGVHFVINAYDLASYAAGKFYAVLRKEEYPDLLVGRYTDGPENSISRIAAYETEEIDGKNLSVLYDDDGSEVNSATVNYGEASAKVDVYGEVQQYLVRTGGRKFLYLNVKTSNDWQSLSIVDLDSPNLAITGFAEGFYDSIPINPDDMILSTRTNLMSTAQISRSYRAGENGIPEPNEPMYKVTVYPEIWLTLTQEARFDVLESPEAEATVGKTFSKGTRFRLWRTDNEKIMDCEAEDGSYVRFTVDQDQYPQKINGKYDLEQLFSGTFFAG